MVRQVVHENQVAAKIVLIFIGIEAVVDCFLKFSPSHQIYRRIVKKVQRKFSRQADAALIENLKQKCEFIAQLQVFVNNFC
jgi:hypothetical protein